MITYHLAEVAELVDALASGASGGNPVEVQVLFSAPSVFYQDSLAFHNAGISQYGAVWNNAIEQCG